MVSNDEAADRARESGALEFKAIPREGNDGAMSVNLALWWLCILAGQSGDIENSYPMLTDGV